RQREERGPFFELAALRQAGAQAADAEADLAPYAPRRHVGHVLEVGAVQREAGRGQLALAAVVMRRKAAHRPVMEEPGDLLARDDLQGHDLGAAAPQALDILAGQFQPGDALAQLVVPAGERRLLLLRIPLPEG